MALMMSASEISLAGRASQNPPSGPALAADQPGPAQLGQDRLQELAGDALRPGKLVSRHVAAAGSSKLDDGAQSVI